MPPTSAAEANLIGTKSPAESAVLGTLSLPLSIAIKTVPKDVIVADAERYALKLQLNQVAVVENLPVPVHISINGLAAAGLAPRSAPPFQCIWEVCESPGLDGHAAEPGLFPSTYQKHEFWQADAAIESSGFTPAASFDGARPGWVFKTGSSGLGYYSDAPPTPDQGGLQLLADPDAMGLTKGADDSGLLMLLPFAVGVAAVVVAVVAAVIVRRL